MIDKKLKVVDEKSVQSLIFEVRGMQVMIDSDVAHLYDYDTKRINETVRRNVNRFPEDFCFQLTVVEYDNFLRSQIATLKPKIGSGKHRKYLPYVFTEQGIAMLSGLLKNDIATETSIIIMRAFVYMRKYLMNNANIINRLTEHDIKL